MDRRDLEITLISAKDLKKVNWFSRMEVYAIVSLSADPHTKQQTPADADGGRNPTWNFPAHFTVPSDPYIAGRLFLHIVLRTTRFLRHRPIGEVRVPIRELLAGAAECPSREQYISYQVRRPKSGKPKGVLTFSYNLGESIAQAGQATAGQTPPHALASYPYMPPEAHDGESKFGGGEKPVKAYPVGKSSAGAMVPYSAYPAYQHPPSYGYGPPPPHHGYAYGPAVGYGYGPAVVMQPPPSQQRKSMFGMGMGAGLLGGAIGGLIIGDMVSDAAIYDAGYDAGFDGGAFDF